MKTIRASLFCGILFSLIVCFSCTDAPTLAGATSETTNGFTASIHDTNGKPVVCAKVRIRPKGYLADTAAAGSTTALENSADIITDSTGRFSFDKLPADQYVIEILDTAGQGAVLFDITAKNPVQDLGTIVIKNTGTLRGSVDTSNLPEDISLFVQIYGLERLIPVDPVSMNFTIDNLPQGSYSVRLITSCSSFTPENFSNTVINSDMVTTLEMITLVPCSGWKFSKKICLNTSASGVPIDQTVTGFPVLIRLSASTFSFDSALTHGEDLRFTFPDGAPCPYEIEYWSASEKKASVWVWIDTIRASDSSQYITMYWGKSDAVSLSSGESTFDTTDGFTGVWHLGEEVAGTGTEGVYKDATVNSFDGNDFISATGNDGVIGSGKYFNNGPGQYDKIILPQSSKLFPGSASSFTISAWFKTGTLQSDLNRIITLYQGDSIKSAIIFGIYKGDSTTLCVYSKEEPPRYPVAKTVIASEWYLGTVSFDNSGWKLYVDGTVADSDTVNTHPQLGTLPATIGAFYNNTASECGFSGALDEIRFEHAVRSKDWIRLCSINQGNADKLIVFK